MRAMKNKKLKAILSITGYLLLLVALCVAGVFIFHSSYYELVYVSGSSMYPTLNGSDDEASGTVVDFGIVDTHASAINHIERFDIISTYYPEDYVDGVLKTAAKRKIKRVIGMPGDTFTIKDGLLSVKKDEEFVNVPYNFKITQTNVKDTTDPITLDKDEYWLLGDNRANSNDCGAFNAPVLKKQIAGVLVAIEGTAKLKIKSYRCDGCGKVFSKRYKSCDKCGGWYFTEQYDLVNKKYGWPKFF